MNTARQAQRPAHPAAHSARNRPSVTTAWVREAQTALQDSQASASQSWVQMSGLWIKAYGDSIGTAMRLQTDLWELASSQARALLPLTHQLCTTWAWPDPLTDRSLWWAAKNWPEST